jgi:Zn-dependent peptidase ImmA (M78 family)
MNRGEKMIPDKVKIAGIDYKVEETEHRDAGEDALMGEINYFTATIYINESANPQIKEQTLVHEIVHGILVAMGRKDLNEDEYFVDGLAYNLHQVLKDNKLTFE